MLSHENIERKIVQLGRKEAGDKSSALGIQIPVNKIIGHISLGQPAEIQRLLAADVLGLIKDRLDCGFKMFERDAAWILSNLVATDPQMSSGILKDDALMKTAIYALNNGKFELKTEISYFLVNMTYCSHVKCILNMLTRNKEIFHDLLEALNAGNSAGHHGSPQFICNVLSVIGNLLNIGLNCQEDNQKYFFRSSIIKTYSNNVQSKNTILEAFLTQDN